jgi:predicted Fe-S protein YdhL (DUF1289 family)
MADTEVIAESPCLGDCNLSNEGICLSCFISSKENDDWNHVSNRDRLDMLERARQRRQAFSEGRSMTEVGTNGPN